MKQLAFTALFTLLISGCNLFKTVESQTASDMEVEPPVEMGMPDLVEAPPDMDDPDMGIEPDMTGTPDLGPLPDFAWTPQTGRVDDGLLVYFTFAEGSGEETIDQAERGGQMPLPLGQGVDWLEGRNGVSILPDAFLRNDLIGAEIYDHVVVRQEMTVEVWFTPANLTQSGPARIVTYSFDSAYRNFTIGQEGDFFSVRFRSEETGVSLNGLPSVETPTVTVAEEKHLVFTYDGLDVDVFVDGEVVSSRKRFGNIEGWERDFAFIVGEEQTSSRPWEGEVYLIAVYDRALDAEEVLQNFEQGSRID